MVHVVKLQLLAAAACIGAVASAVCRPPANHTRLDGQELFLVRAVLFVQLALHQGAGTEYGNITLENGPDVRKLIQRGLTQKPADAGDTGVVVNLVFLAVLLQLLQRQHVLKTVCIGAHAAEFRNINILAAPALAVMLVNDGSAVATLHNDCKNQIQPREDDQKHPRSHDIKQALGPEVAAVSEAAPWLKIARGGAALLFLPTLVGCGLYLYHSHVGRGSHLIFFVALGLGTV